MTTDIEIDATTSEQRRWWAWALASSMALTLSSGCVTSSGELGGVEDDDGGAESGEGSTGPGLGGSEGGETGSGESGEPEPAACEDVGASPPRGLTRVQYANTVRDLFGVAEGPWTDFAQEPWVFGASSFGATFDMLPLTPATEAAYQALAPLVAQAIEPATLLPCAPDTPDPEGCAATFVPQLGRAVWRRPLTPDEVDALLLQYQGVDLVEGTRAVVETMLASPEFYALREQGTPVVGDPGLLELDDHSIAARLSYFVWGSTPDEVLLARADAGELVDPLVRAEEVDRMLADPRAAAQVGELYAQLLDVRRLDTLGKADPAYTPELTAAMETEVRLFAADVVLGSGDGRLATLLQAPYTFVDDDLSALYGADVLGTTGAPGPDTFVRAELDPAHRGGLMTLSGVMARHSYSNQVGLARRGYAVRQAWLCQILPPPPPDITPPPEAEGRYDTIAAILAEPVCAGCHSMLEGPQVAFDHFDELGRWQAQIEGEPVQSQGELVNVSVGTVSFDGHAELVDELLALPDTRTCVAQQHLRFALQRPLDAADECTAQALADRLTETDDDLGDLIRTLVTTEAFARVRPD